METALGKKEKGSFISLPGKGIHIGLVPSRLCPSWKGSVSTTYSVSSKYGSLFFLFDFFILAASLQWECRILTTLDHQESPQNKILDEDGAVVGSVFFCSYGTFQNHQGWCQESWWWALVVSEIAIVGPPLLEWRMLTKNRSVRECFKEEKCQVPDRALTN